MGKITPKAPTPDPLIGQAAAGNVALGKEALEFSRQQYADGKIRQADLDALTAQVANSALESQNLANKWAQEDRDVSTALRNKYEGYADADRQLGRDTAAWADRAANAADVIGQNYERIYADEAARQSTFGQEEVNRYRNTFRPVQDRIVSDAMTWDSDERLESEAGKAKADIVANAAQQRAAQQRSMASMGVNPNSGRFAGVERATDTLTALGAAGAQNAARDNVRAQGIAQRTNAAQLGQQVLANGQQANQIALSSVGAGQQARQSGMGLAMQAKNLGLAASGVGNTTAGLSVGNQGAGYSGIGTGIQAGNAAIGANQAANSGWASTGGVMQNGFGTAIGANASGAGIANGLYGSQLNAWGAQQQSRSSGLGALGSLIGTGAALYLKG